MTFAEIVRSLSYFLLIVAGGTLVKIIEGDASDVPVWLWHSITVWMILGAIVSFAGQVRQRWTGEYIGLPLVSSALIGLGVLQGYTTRWAIEAIPSLSILWAFSFLAVARWQEVRIMYRVANEEAN